jgi:hypothetical protein
MDTSENSRIELVDQKHIPPWFHYPEPFVRTIGTGMVLLRPWRFLGGAFSLSRMAGLKERFPARDLFPFALRTDRDDVACWERGGLDQIVIIHDFADPGWEQIAVFETFWDWFRSAIEDFIAFEP